ncbi:e35763d0-0614-4668-a41e-7763e367a6f7 [Thermothielavioides terrestris]|uniref:E35763d0-0614-4668-a41e-7763e367a6f7 n=1 Tax=Thermothielavioides terrestris TaxID=2587410 RepID=A0A3S4AKG1_9PEZI|nr:e35763d0-0614-4668-a41e-7763e367a6f7 [Thermothielavioides terrestris]
MCNFIQREYGCGHFRFIASKWCRSYTTTHKRCPPDVTHFEYVEHLCGDCKDRNRPPVPWADLIKGYRERGGAAAAVSL